MSFELTNISLTNYAKWLTSFFAQIRIIEPIETHHGHATMTHTIEQFTTKLASEVAADPFFEGRTDNLPTYEVDKNGRKYIRIVMDSHGQKSVWGFIERATGLIYKAAGWKGPAKHARGHIDTSEYGKNYSWTGPAYLA